MALFFLSNFARNTILKANGFPDMEILTTNGITISVETQYLPAHSNPREEKFIFGYHIVIENGSPYTVQLLRRHWLIKDADGRLREVEGEGVIGQQPVLEPGESHEYASFCNLRTDLGKMRGAYLMKRRDDDSLFEVAIPEFRMVAPFKMN
jgi:ApaG protein